MFSEKLFSEQSRLNIAKLPGSADVPLPRKEIDLKAFWISLVMLFVAGGCGSVPSSAITLPAITPTSSQGQDTLTQSSGENSSGNPVSPINTPDFSDMTPPPAPTNPFVRSAEEDLANRLNVNMDQIHFLKISDIDWQDITQGCTQTPGQTLKKGKLSGYRIWLEADGKNYAYHVGLYDRIILCHD
jgi:hypothetical protein